MEPDFPQDLPRPHRSGYQLAIAGNSVIAQRDRPAARARSISTQSVTLVTLTWIFTDDQFATFAQWWRYFYLDGTRPAQVALAIPYGDLVVSARFLGTYQADDLDGAWAVKVRAEIENPPHLSADDITTLIDNGGYSLDVAGLHHLIHVVFPTRLY